ncbi:MAG: class I SAM-dependent methyltransferase [Candidatus Alcyoniella australis]|nr:class I SAM-dependent methyltransferase [Candidatus Alcyoniella australis]
MGWMLRVRRDIERGLVAAGHYHWLSALRLSVHRALVPRLQRLSRGACLDVGAGLSPYRVLIERNGADYTSLDLPDGPGAPDISADLQHMPEAADESYDLALCANVLEHVPDPSAALAELHRVLKPGGDLLLSAPHLSRLHEVPHDYWRFTRFGLEHLLSATGFEIRAIEPTGGALCFIAHQLSTALLLLTWPVPLLRQLGLAFNYALLLWPPLLLDRLLDPHALLAAGYVVEAHKPDPTQSKV